MAYIQVGTGLGGLYMFDNVYVLNIKTRRELMSFVLREREQMIDAYGYGDSIALAKKKVTYLWRNRRRVGEQVILWFGRSRHVNDRPFGLFLSINTRAGYLESEREFM